MSKNDSKDTGGQRKLNYYQKNKQKILKQLKERYREDKEFREKARETYRSRYQTDPEYRETTLQRAKDRYHNDENYRNATIERSRKAKKKK